MALPLPFKLHANFCEPWLLLDSHTLIHLRLLSLLRSLPASWPHQWMHSCQHDLSHCHCFVLECSFIMLVAFMEAKGKQDANLRVMHKLWPLTDFLECNLLARKIDKNRSRMPFLT